MPREPRSDTGSLQAVGLAVLRLPKQISTLAEHRCCTQTTASISNFSLLHLHKFKTFYIYIFFTGGTRHS